jgi:hypothetical protein
MPDFVGVEIAVFGRVFQYTSRQRHRTVEGRKSHAELRPEVVAVVRQLRRRRPKGDQRSLRDIATELAKRGIVNERGMPFLAASISTVQGYPAASLRRCGCHVRRPCLEEASPPSVGLRGHSGVATTLAGGINS